VNNRFTKDEKNSDYPNGVKISFCVFVATIMGLVFSLFSTFTSPVYAADPSPPPETTPTEHNPQVKDADPAIVTDSNDEDQAANGIEIDQPSEAENQETGGSDPTNEGETQSTEEGDPETDGETQDTVSSDPTIEEETQSTAEGDPESDGETPDTEESDPATDGESQTPIEGDPVEGQDTLPQDSPEPTTAEDEFTDAERPEAALTETLSNESQLPSEDPNQKSPIDNPQKSSINNPQSVVPDPYFFINGDKHSFLPEGGDCAGAANCQVSTTPIQDALNAVSGGLTPDDQTLYIEGGIYTEDVTINEMSDLTLQGAADNHPSTLAGSVSVSASLNITLRNFIFGEVIQISDSADVTIVGTEGDDQIGVDLEGTVDNLSVEGGAGSDTFTINTEEDTDLGQSESQVNLDESLEVVNINVQDSGNEVKVEGKIDIPGGQLTINNPEGDVIVDSSGGIDVSDDADAGEIEINAQRIASFGLLSADGQGDPSSSPKGTGHGGTIHILASDIVVIGNDARITANASLHGNGGEILAIAEGHAAIASSAILQARGGSQSGDGGFIETSGYQSFDIGAIPDVSAASGKDGEWLLDPGNDIEVISGSTNTNINESPTGVFNTTADDAKIGVDNIVSALGSGNVTITTGNVGSPPGGNGDVTWNADLDYSGSIDRTLSVNADGSITISKTIKGTGSGKLNINLTAGGNVDINDQIVTKGELTIIGGGNVNVNNAGTGFRILDTRGGGVIRRRAKITSHFETAELIGVWFDSVVPGRQEIVWMKI